MTKKKKIVIAICCLLVLIIILREFGILDFSLYKSQMSSSKSASTYHTDSSRKDGDGKFSYKLTIKDHKGAGIYNFAYKYNDLTPINIVAVIEEPKYSGKYYMPFIKNFEMDYRCKFSTLPPKKPHDFGGEIKGKINANIHGICSREKAKKLIFEEAKKSIIAYLKNQLETSMKKKK